MPQGRWSPSGVVQPTQATFGIELPESRRLRGGYNGRSGSGVDATRPRDRGNSSPYEELRARAHNEQYRYVRIIGSVEHLGERTGYRLKQEVAKFDGQDSLPLFPLISIVWVYNVFPRRFWLAVCKGREAHECHGTI